METKSCIRQDASGRRGGVVSTVVTAVTGTTTLHPSDVIDYF